MNAHATIALSMVTITGAADGQHELSAHASLGAEAVLDELFTAYPEFPRAGWLKHRTCIAECGWSNGRRLWRVCR